jgi:hypothetical protein
MRNHFQVKIPKALNPLLIEEQNCSLCGYLLTTPVQICKHYVDLVCFIMADGPITCTDSECMVPQKAAFKFPCNELRVDMLKVAQIEKLAVVDEAQYRAWFNSNNELLADFAIAEASDRLKLDEIAIRFEIPKFRQQYLMTKNQSGHTE